MAEPFSTLPLRPELLKAIEQIGYLEMTPIQAQGLPLMLEGRDVTGQAKTGSGKTAAFGLAVLNAIDTTLLATQAVVLCPTRELADQVAAELRRLAQRAPAGVAGARRVANRVPDARGDRVAPGQRELRRPLDDLPGPARQERGLHLALHGPDRPAPALRPGLRPTPAP